MTSKEHNNSIPLINGLVLAGGKSRRMGTAKDLLHWHGKEQRYFAADLLAPFCEEVFISCRQDQLESVDPNYHALTDTFLNMGPFGGILSALRAQRDKAWLVIACDLPLLDKKSLEFLIESRDPEKAATTYESPFDGLPEPLITIWEPKSYPLLLHFLGMEKTCPRKVLIHSDTLILKSDNPDALMNVNTPDDAEKAQKILKG
nr:NTP transferase domain-containing protein [uncultured Chryseobacterium sp.]